MPLGDAAVDKFRGRIRNRATAIRAYCAMCQGGAVAEIRACESVTCSLFPFRMGKDPLRGFEIPKVIIEHTDDDGDDSMFDDGTQGDTDNGH